MESNQYFSVLILAVCVIHLAATAGARMQSWWQTLAIGRYFSERQMARAAEGSGQLAKTDKIQHDDWYVFFHCADLVGKEPSSKGEFSANRKSLLPPLKKTQTSRRQPEVRLTLS